LRNFKLYTSENIYIADIYDSYFFDQPITTLHAINHLYIIA